MPRRAGSREEVCTQREPLTARRSLWRVVPSPSQWSMRMSSGHGVPVLRTLASWLATSISTDEANSIGVNASAPPGELDLSDAAGLSPDEVLSRSTSGPDGLSSGDVAERLQRFGPNTLGTHRVRATAVLFRQNSETRS